MTAEEYEALARRDHAAAAAAALALGDRALGLAVNLAARRPAGATGSTYTFWLRLWRCPTPPAGWRWSGDGDELISARWGVAVRKSGPAAVDLARQIDAALGGPTQVQMF